MLSSTLVVTTASTTASTVSSTITASVMSVGVPEISVYSVVCLIILLAASEILSASSLWNRRLSAMLNMATVPLLMTFVLIVCFKVLSVINA